MATTPTTPTTPPTTPAAPEPIIATPPKPPTPLDPPEVFFNKKWKVPPVIVHTQEEADALDPTEWTQNPPPAGAKPADPEFPKLYYNINVAPKLVDNADEEKALSSDWREFTVPDSLIKSSQAKLDAAKK